MQRHSYKTFIIALILSWTSSLVASGQTDSTTNQPPKITLTGFTDIYYGYDFNQPVTGFRQPFLYNHNRHNEFNMNLGIIKLGVEHQQYRANFALQSGTYAQDNYAAEQGLLKNVFEANIGIALNNKKNLWLDAGIFPSHLGFESAISVDNLTLTRSLCAENSPYFLSGAKLTFNPSNKVELATIVTNGWQRIQRLPGNSMTSFGTQVIIKPTDNININWSTFIGTDDPDSTRRMRYFNNVYTQISFSNKVQVIAGFDIGVQQQSKNSSQYDIWFTPTLIGQLTISDNWKTAIRAEYFQDETGIIIPTGTPNGFNTTGLSWNLDYLPNEVIACRIESRLLRSKDKIFVRENTNHLDNLFVGASIALKISRLIDN